MVYCGIDLSLTATGVAILKDADGSDFKVISKLIQTKPSDHSNKWVRIKFIVDQIKDFINTHDAKYVILEDYIISQINITTTTKLVEVGACVRMMLNDMNMPFMTVVGSQLKKYITGTGSSKKSSILKDLYKLYNVDVDDDNEGDAIVLAMMCRDVAEKLTPDKKYQEAVIKKIIKTREHYNWTM